MPGVKTPFFVFRGVSRTTQILEIMIKYEFGGFLDRIRIWEHTNIQKRILHHNPGIFIHLSSAERLRLALSELGLPSSNSAKCYQPARIFYLLI